MNHFIKLSFVFIFVSLNAQDFALYEMEYTRGGERFLAQLFDVPACSEDAIKDEWKTFIGNHQAKVEFVNRIKGVNEANGFVSPKLSGGPYYVVFDLLKKPSDGGYQIINVFSDAAGNYINSSSSSDIYLEFQELMRDFSYEIRLSCVRKELLEANEAQAKLNDTYFELTRKRSRLRNSIIKEKNRILKWEKESTDNMTEIGSLELKAASTPDNKLQKQLEKLKGKQENLKSNLSATRASIETEENDIKNLETEMQELEVQTEAQKLVIAEINNRLIAVKR